MDQPVKGIVTELQHEFKIGSVKVKTERLANPPRFTAGDILRVEGAVVINEDYHLATGIKVISDWRRFVGFAMLFLLLMVMLWRDPRTEHLFALLLMLFLFFALCGWRAWKGKWPPNNFLRWL